MIMLGGMKNMIHMNLARLRKLHNMTQEELAEQINVSRQAVAKWENGDSMPDLKSCMALADFFNVSIDDLIHHSEKDTGLVIAPKGKHFFGAVTVGERGQIVIPKKARELFSIQPGDQLLVLGDEERGVALVHQRDLMNFVGAMGIALPANEK